MPGIGLSTGTLDRDDFDLSRLRDAPIPVVVEPGSHGVDLVDWATDRKKTLQSILRQNGAIRFRGFDGHGLGLFEELAALFISERFEYSFPLTPRSQISTNVTTSTEYPPEAVIPLHSECCAQPDWPLVIMFYCEVVAARGGETPLADNRRLYEALPPRVRDKFERLGVLYVRNLTGESGLRLAFQTTEPAVIADFCVKNRYEFSEIGEGRYRVRWFAPAVATHPETGEKLWFNHIQTFHLSSLPSYVVGAGFGRGSGLPPPLEVFYSDESPIEDDVIRLIRRTGRSLLAASSWVEGDMLLVDNMRVSHGRNSFEGPRRVLVSMGNPYSRLNR